MGELSSKTRVLVTHHLHYLPQADHVLYMDAGRVVAQGTFEALQQTCEPFRAMVAGAGVHSEDHPSADGKGGKAGQEAVSPHASPRVAGETGPASPVAMDMPLLKPPRPVSTATRQRSTGSTAKSERSQGHRSRQTSIGSATGSRRHRAGTDVSSVTGGGGDASVMTGTVTGGADAGPDGEGNLMTKEEREEGVVKLSVITRYLGKLGGSVFFTIFTLLVILVQGCMTGSDFWIAAWTGDSFDQGWRWYIGIYAALVMAGGVFQGIRTIMVRFGGLRAARVLHQQLSLHVFGAPMSFFDSVPVGRLLNRFSSDMNAIDMALTHFIEAYWMTILWALGSLIIIAIVNPIFIIAMIFVAFVYFDTFRFFRPVGTATPPWPCPAPPLQTHSPNLTPLVLVQNANRISTTQQCPTTPNLTAIQSLMSLC